MVVAEATSYADIGGLLNVQKSYLADISAGAQTQNGLGDPTKVAENLTKVDASLNSLATAWAGNSSAYLLTGQDTVYTILDREKNRLAQKSDSIDIASQGQNRLIQLNTNYKKRYEAYNAIILTVVIALALFAGLVALRSVPFIPAVALNVASVVLLAATVIYCARRYASIVTRDSIYFDEIDTNSNLLKGTGSIVQDLCGNGIKTSGAGLTFGMGSCLGQSCCSGNTFWDSAASVCVPNIDCSTSSDGHFRNPTTNTCQAAAYVSGMTTLATAYSLGDMTRRGDATPYAPAEVGSHFKV